MNGTNRQGADEKKKDRWGKTPLDEAREGKNQEMIQTINKAVRARNAKKKRV